MGGKHEENGSLRRLKLRYKSNIVAYLKEVEWEDVNRIQKIFHSEPEGSSSSSGGSSSSSSSSIS